MRDLGDEPQESRSWFSRFRLVELAAVAIILIVCAAALLPGVFGSHGHPSRSPCQNNLKECALALQIYTHDYDGHLPSSMLVSGSKKWSKTDFVEFATIRGQLPSPQLSPGVAPTHGARTWCTAVYPYMKNKDINYCPQDPAWKRPTYESTVSYWWKAAVDRAWYGDGCPKPYRKLSDFEWDADQIVLYEHKPFHYAKRSGRWLWTRVEVPEIEDGALINVAYLDTHVRTIEIVNGPKPGDQLDPAGPGEPMYFNSEWIGKGLKTLPPGTPAQYIDPSKYSDKL